MKHVGHVRNSTDIPAREVALEGARAKKHARHVRAGAKVRHVACTHNAQIATQLKLSPDLPQLDTAPLSNVHKLRAVSTILSTKAKVSHLARECNLIVARGGIRVRRRLGIRPGTAREKQVRPDAQRSARTLL